jgi:hypothetical protein
MKDPALSALMGPASQGAESEEDDAAPAPEADEMESKPNQQVISELFTGIENLKGLCSQLK